MPPKKLLACLFVALASILSVVQGAESTTPGANGLIAYGQEVAPDHYQLFTIRPDGSGRQQITRGASSATNPDWAPNGSTIAFGLERTNTAGIALIAAFGGKQRVLTPKGFQGQPSFSPDGKWIAYERDATETDNGVWLMRSDGTGLHRLTRNPFHAGGECGCDTDPNFSPDGKWISFVRIKRDHELQSLFVVHPNGKGLHQITPYAWEVAIKHDWSPDGRRILLTTNADFIRAGASANIVTIRPDGSGKTELTRFTGGTTNAFAGSFSPDGKQIVFRLEEGDTYSLAVADGDGGNVRKLTTGKGKPRFIDWGTHQ
jgi:Tol biopolymer transport system component